MRIAFTKHYALAWFDRASISGVFVPMAMSVTHSHAAAPALRGLLPFWVGAFTYALVVLGGNRLLIDPDTKTIAEILLATDTTGSVPGSKK